MKPMLFNTDMVRALLDGRKTVTRRVVKPQDPSEPNPHLFAKMPYSTGDILYVRETWAAWSPTYGTVPEIIYKADGYSQSHKMKWRPSIHMPHEAARIFLRVTDVRVERLQSMTEADAVAEGFEAIKCDHPCGCPCTDCMDTGYLEPAMLGFVETWNSTIKPADLDFYGWDANPFVWVISFDRCEKPEEV